VDQDPVADLDAAGLAEHETDVDLTPDAVNVCDGPLLSDIENLDELAGNAETHTSTSVLGSEFVYWQWD
jgi:hypothetical protein